MSFFSALEDFAKALFGNLWAFIKPLLAQAARDGLNDAIPIALQVVMDFAAAAQTGTPIDLNAEVKAVADKLATLGKKVAFSTITAAIALAVKKLQEDGKLPQPTV